MVLEKTGILRRALIGALQAPVRAYRFFFSPLIGHDCRFHPTCSAYALEALEKHGPLRGLWLTAARLLSCHPYAKRPFNDPVPVIFPAIRLGLPRIILYNRPTADRKQQDCNSHDE